MTTPILEPLLAVTAALPASAQRETPADDSAFRELLAPPRTPTDDAPTTESRATNEESSQPPICSAPPASDEVPATDEQDEQEEEEPRDATETVTAIVVTEPTPIAPTEPNVEVAAIDARAETITEIAEPDAKTKSSPVAFELTGEDLPAGETASAAAVQIDVAETSAAVETASAGANVADHVEPQTPSFTAGEVATAASETSAEDEATATTATDISPEVQHATNDAVKAQHDSPPNDRPATAANDPELTKTPIATVQIAEPTAPAKRPPGKGSETEKRETKRVGDIGARNVADAPPETTAANVADNIAPNAQTTPVATEAAIDAKPNAAVEAPPVRADANAVPGAPPATAERLGTMLAQRRVKMSASGHGPALTESQQARLVQRVARAFDTARMRGDAEIRLRLSPPELGALKLEVRMESGVMTARMEVETVAAQQALADNLGTLRQRLAEQNIRVEQFDIDLMDRHNGNPSDSPTGQFNQDERQTQRGPTRMTPSQRTSQPVNSAAEPRVAARASGGLDVLI